MDARATALPANRHKVGCQAFENKRTMKNVVFNKTLICRFVAISHDSVVATDTTFRGPLVGMLLDLETLN